MNKAKQNKNLTYKEQNDSCQRGERLGSEWNEWRESRDTTSSYKISHGDIMYSMAALFNNIVEHTFKLPRE